MHAFHDLQRFVDAQNPVIDRVRMELGQGRKTGHWMWFIFPQIQGLGWSETAQYFSIASLAEAKAYLSHPVLGSRLRECTALATQIQGKPIERIFGFPDNLKFQSSMTLFAQSTADNSVFLSALAKYFEGEVDQQTLARI